MSRFAVLLGRFALIALGYAAAAFAASLFMNIIMAGAGGLEASQSDDFYLAGLIVSIGAGTLFIGYFAFLPAMVAIVAAEILGKRDWLFHVIGGAIVAALVVTLFRETGGEVENDPALIMMAAAGGITGASVYWLIAGRGAGSWHKRPSETPLSIKPNENRD